MFDLAYHGRGLAINLSEVPDDIQLMMIEWLNEANEYAKAELNKIARR